MPYKYREDYNDYMRDYRKRQKVRNPKIREQQYNQLFRNTLHTYFPKLQNQNIELFLANKKEWIQIFKEFFPNDDPEKCKGMADPNTLTILIPAYRKYPKPILIASYIHELAHLLTRRDGHDVDWYALMVKAAWKSKDDLILYYCILGDAAEHIRKKALSEKKPKPRNKFPRFPRKYRPNWF